jgi:hypothetical protein
MSLGPFLPLIVRLCLSRNNPRIISNFAEGITLSFIPTLLFVLTATVVFVCNIEPLVWATFESRAFFDGLGKGAAEIVLAIVWTDNP